MLGSGVYSASQETLSIQEQEELLRKIELVQVGNQNLQIDKGIRVGKKWFKLSKTRQFLKIFCFLY